MKRYGYKFLKDDGGPAIFDDLRAYTLFSPLVYIALTVMELRAYSRIDAQQIIASYIAAGFILVMATLLSEIFPRIGISLMVTGCLLFSGLVAWVSIAEGVQPPLLIMAFYLITSAAFGVWTLSKYVAVDKAKQARTH